VQRTDYLKNIHRLVVKIGSSVLTDSKGHPAPSAFQAVVDQAMDLMNHGMETVLVSSGAMASGKAVLGQPGEKTSIPEKQALAAIGQSLLPQGRQADAYKP